METMLRPLRRYADFARRASRREFWLFMLALFVGFVVAGALDTLFGTGGGYERTAVSGGWGSSTAIVQHGGLIAGVFWLVTLIPGIAVAVRRLHDSDKSGWWLLIGLVPLAGWLALFVFYVQPSTPGDNRFGPPPPA